MTFRVEKWHPEEGRWVPSTYPELNELFPSERFANDAIKTYGDINRRYHVISVKSPKGAIVNSVKQYVEQHKDVFLTILFVAVLDHFLFDGAFREKLKTLVDKFLDTKVEAHAATT